MIEPTQQDILRALSALCESSPGVRFGQLLANLGFLTEDMSDQTLWGIEDAELLRIIERHRADLCKRQAYDAEPCILVSRSRHRISPRSDLNLQAHVSK